MAHSVPVERQPAFGPAVALGVAVLCLSVAALLPRVGLPTGVLPHSLPGLQLGWLIESLRAPAPSVWVQARKARDTIVYPPAAGGEREATGTPSPPTFEQSDGERGRERMTLSEGPVGEPERGVLRPARAHSLPSTRDAALPWSISTLTRPFGPSSYDSYVVTAAHLESGKASWYGYEAGTRTATGERWDPRGLTAASNTLPLNTRVHVINRASGKRVDVRVNDRGGFTRLGRIIDLSQGAFQQIAELGTGVIGVDIYLAT